jgi:hypothetical protein
MPELLQFNRARSADIPDAPKGVGDPRSPTSTLFIPSRRPHPGVGVEQSRAIPTT